MKIVSVSQMQQIERSADASGVSYEQMMRYAGEGISVWIHQHYSGCSPIIGLVGSGNNGGDTLIALTALARFGYQTFAFMVKQRSEDDSLIEHYLGLGGSVTDISNGDNLDFFSAVLRPGALLMDGILGTGLKLPLRGSLKEVMGKISERIENCPDAVKIAIDCPSGADCDTGEVSEVTISANFTLFMGAMKSGLLKYPAREYSGDFHYIDIGIGSLEDHLKADLPVLVTAQQAETNLPHRPSQGHKGTFGTVYVIAGSVNFVGAAHLTGKAAYRSGCGLVHMSTISDVYQALAGTFIEAIWTILPKSAGGFDPVGIDVVKSDLLKSNIVVAGPGWGLSENNSDFLKALLEVLPSGIPALFDADGLKLLSRIDHWWEKIPSSSVLTPHPGEMSILTGLKVEEIQANRWVIAQEYARKWKKVVLLKGAITVVAAPNGAMFILPFSDLALATAGSGDVLSGIIAGLVAQGMDTTRAAYCGAWIHACAGKAARQKMGHSASVTSLDILSHIAQGFNITVVSPKKDKH